MATEIADQLQSTGTEVPAPAPRKRSMFLNILIGLAAVVAVLAIIIAMRPSDFRVTRSAMMAAPPAEVFRRVNDLHNWDAWSPWAKLDPNATNRLEGPTAGEGAKFYWSGNNEVGEGSMTILESQPNERIRLRLDFVRPFAGTSDVQFTFQPEGENQTAVSWSIAGTNNFMAKAVGLVIDCEKMTGDQFEKGLANMKAIVEKSP